MGFVLLHMIMHCILILLDLLALRTDIVPIRIGLIRVGHACGLGGWIGSILYDPSKELGGELIHTARAH